MITKSSQQFGGSEYAIQGSMGCSIEEARDFKEAYDSGFPGIAGFKKKGSEFVRKNGYILMCQYSGHKMYWWDHGKWLRRQKSFTHEFWEKYKRHKGTGDAVAQRVSEHFRAASKYDRMALNAPTQGSGAVILKMAMTDFFNWVVDNNYFKTVELSALVHDEANVIYPKELHDTVPAKLQECMEAAAALVCTKVPIPAEPAVNDHWEH